MNYKKFFFAIIILIIITSGIYIITNNNNNNEVSYNTINDKKINQSEGSEFLMDTLVRIRIHDENSKEVLEEAFNKLEYLESILSKTINDSDISKINNNAGIKSVNVKNESYELIEEAYYFSKITNGAFDPTIGPLVSLWGIGTEDERIPSESEINNKLNLVDYTNIQIDNDSIYLKEKDMTLDLGAIAKGYAADYLIEYFNNVDVESAFINMGGNVSVHGTKIDGSLWKVGIQDPDQTRGNIIAAVEGRDISVVTSGNYERYFTENGVRYHHIINPETGYPARNGIISSTVVSKNSSYADALSTSLYILGVEESFELIKEIDDVSIVLVTEDDKIYVSENLRNIITFTDNRFEIEYR